MNDEANAGGTVGWVIAVVIVAAIVAFVLFARGPEDQERSAAPPAVAAVMAAA